MELLTVQNWSDCCRRCRSRGRRSRAHAPRGTPIATPTPPPLIPPQPPGKFVSSTRVFSPYRSGEPRSIGIYIDRAPLTRTLNLLNWFFFASWVSSFLTATLFLLFGFGCSDCFELDESYRCSPSYAPLDTVANLISGASQTVATSTDTDDVIVKENFR